MQKLKVIIITKRNNKISGLEVLKKKKKSKSNCENLNISGLIVDEHEVTSHKPSRNSNSKSTKTQYNTEETHLKTHAKKKYIISVNNQEVLKRVRIDFFKRSRASSAMQSLAQLKRKKKQGKRYSLMNPKDFFVLSDLKKCVSLNVILIDEKTMRISFSSDA